MKLNELCESLGITVKKHGQGKRAFDIIKNNQTIGFLTKKPKAGSVGEWVWFWLSKDQKKHGPFSSKQKALSEFNSQYSE